LEPFFCPDPGYTAAMPQPKLYSFSTTIGEACAQAVHPTFQDLADKLKMDVTDLTKQCNAKTPPTRALVKGVAKQLGMDEGLLERLAEEVRRDLGPK
jgi:hypothetical protein